MLCTAYSCKVVKLDMQVTLQVFYRKSRVSCQNISNLTYKTFTNKFNESYSETLSEEQKSLLSKYILSFVDNGLELKMFLNEEIGRLKKEVSSSREIEEISSEYILSYSGNGNLLGHNVIGRDMVRDFISKIKDFPEHYSKKIEHVILSHQGRYEWKSHKLPSFPEALLIHLIGFSDSRMSLMDIAIENDQEEADFTNKYNYFGIPILKNSEPK